MIDVAVYNLGGEEVGKFAIDEALLGGTVRPALLKQAAVMYHANKRQGTVRTRSRAEVAGSTKKLYAQKHTGNARRGNLRTNVMKGGGMAFAKRPRDFRQDMPLKQRRLARNNAILAKIQSNNLKILDSLQLEAPKTKTMATALQALQADRTVLIATQGIDRNTYLAARNIRGASIIPAAHLSAGDILNSRALIITRGALEDLLKGIEVSKSKGSAATA